MRSGAAIIRPSCVPPKRVKELRDLEQRIQEDYSNLLRTLTG